MPFKKNTAVTGFAFGLVSATDGSDITTGTPVGYYTLDGGSQSAINDVTPVHEGNGLWTVDLLAAEMNGDIVALTFTHASAITAHFIIKTETKLVSELNDISAANVNTEVADVMKTDTNSTDGLAGDLPESPSMEGAIGYIYKFLRNKKTSTSTQTSVYDDAGTTIDHKSTHSDNGTTYTEEEYVSGP